MAEIIKFSPQQAAIIDAVKNGKTSLIIRAGAGCGKSFTLVQAARAIPNKRVAIVAFNRKIAKELKEKTQGDRHVWVGTIHSFGNRALKRGYPHLDGVEPDRKKLSILFDGLMVDWAKTGNADYIFRMKSTICKLVSLAKQRAVIGHEIDDQQEWLEIIEHFDLMENGKEQPPLTPIEVARYARQLLIASIDDKKTYDFDDMIYVPLVKNMPFPKFDVIMVDEAQDTNPARRLLVRRMMREGTRIIAVGDERQAIYGFTGADNDALQQIEREFRAQVLPLTTTYRCPKRVVEFAAQWVGPTHLTAHETAPEGKVGNMTWLEFIQHPKTRSEGSATAILCRNNAPLVAAAFNLIRNRVPCKIEGRDIADGLKKLAGKWKITRLDVLLERLDKHLADQTVKLKDKEMKLAQLTDQVETLKVVIDQCQQEKKNKLADLDAYLDQLFGEDVQGMLVLCSIHKSKGLEWDNVFWLDRHNTCPSKYARKDWQQEQEVNLMYVAATRSKSALYDLYSPAKDIKVGPPQPNPILNPEQTAAVEARMSLSDTLKAVAKATPHVGARQEPARKSKKSVETAHVPSDNAKADIDQRYAAGEISKEERARLHKARRARERKSRAS